MKIKGDVVQSIFFQIFFLVAAAVVAVYGAPQNDPGFEGPTDNHLGGIQLVDSNNPDAGFEGPVDPDSGFDGPFDSNFGGPSGP